MTFGERLYELRNKKNISQEDLAELLDVSLDYLMRGIDKEDMREK